MMTEEAQNKLMVTVWCLTYNHRKYIEKCIEGFLMQKTNFIFEVVIHDDASTDGTSDVVRHYSELYPSIIKPIYETENQYLKYDGFVYRLIEKEINGKYVAVCEGDDYWTDPLKLQKQFDFMESHPDYSLVTHQTDVVNPDGVFVYHINERKEGPINKIDYRLDFPHISSFFYINIRHKCYFTPERQDKAYLFNGWDKSLALLLFSIGKIYYMNETMSCYRKNLHGDNWTSRALISNQTLLRMKNELGLINQIKSYGLNINADKRYYSNVVLYSLLFMINHPSKYNYHILIHSFTASPNRFKCIVSVITALPRSFLHYLKYSVFNVYRI